MNRKIKSRRKLVTVDATSISKRRGGGIDIGFEADTGVSTGLMPEPSVGACRVGGDA